MRFVRCGSKLFRPDAITAVDLDYRATASAPTEVRLILDGLGTLIFRGYEADAVRAFYGRVPATDLLRRDEPEPAEAVAPNHSTGEC